MTTNVKKFQWEAIPEEPLVEGVTRKLVTGEKTMVAQIHLKKGAILPKHNHENEQVSSVVSGKLKFWYGENLENEHLVNSGDVLVIPSNVPHKIEALEETLDIDIFVPPRQDWLSGEDIYTQK